MTTGLIKRWLYVCLFLSQEDKFLGISRLCLLQDSRFQLEMAFDSPKEVASSVMSRVNGNPIILKGKELKDFLAAGFRWISFKSSIFHEA